MPSPERYALLQERDARIVRDTRDLIKRSYDLLAESRARAFVPPPSKPPPQVEQGSPNQDGSDDPALGWDRVQDGRD